MELKKGMVLKEDIYSLTGVLLLKKGTVLKDDHMHYLSRHKIQIQEHDQAKDLIGKKFGELNEVVYRSVYSSVQELQRSISGKSKLNDNEIQEMVDTFQELHEEFALKDVGILELMERFSKDEYLFKHSINVGLIASKIGRILKLSEKHQQFLASMGLFHDVGKFKIDPMILNKPSRLTDEEFNLLKQHPKLGYDLLSKTSLHPLILEGVLKHHERLNGTGYPNRLNGDSIPFFIRILSVADTFDAICSNRVYRSSMSIFYAVDELIKEVKQNRLDEAIVLPFTNSLMELAKGKKITLRNGKVGEILHIDFKYPNQPILKIEGFKPLNLQKENLTLNQVANM
ncbi:HD-GYP domain-containing protein (c-di-GMP phosphodiesterase class II) [Bacillus sp. SLBN-46]|uniref:HD-GYP domain-containing protein n=1 Tax=Bacillus sp. SLBN-46 TaxID=3042283 RepID=UPI00285DDB6A|nr:HD domain-containing phosphohydrolase [Bacillus sp. SLBN-46]MDR6124984.1 HD-GYP domain-containing protein (c-di-GMP phosphodiesterase class II) [Bacillus sp. SLBN-46]